MSYNVASLEPKFRERTGRLRASSPSDLDSHDIGRYAHIGVGGTATSVT